jgi:hypothetical protein
MLTGIGLTASSGTVDAYNEQGWGRDTWGSEVWGASGFWAFAPVTGIGLTANLGTVDAKPVTIASPTGIGLTSRRRNSRSFSRCNSCWYWFNCKYCCRIGNRSRR